jgi:two-component system, NtrC family, sensor kinase
MWSTLRRNFQSVLRYRLLALVLLPLVLAMSATLGYTLYWLNGYTRDTLYASTGNHLALAQHALGSLESERQADLAQFAQSADFLAALQGRDPGRMQRLLAHWREDHGLAFLHLTGPAGNWLYETATGTVRTSKPSPLTDRAARGIEGAGIELFRPPDLRREGGAVAAAPGGAANALMLRLVHPIIDERGRAAMILDGAMLLNGNSGFLDAIRDRTFGRDVLPDGAEPTVALLLGDVRVAASSRDDGRDTGIGERVSEATSALSGAERWVGRDRVAGEDYVLARGPLYDVNGQRVGLLGVGSREAAYQATHYRAVALLLLLFLAATAAAAWIAVRGARTILRPIERMAAVVRATQAGEDRRIGPVAAHDEIGELARQFDAMLDQLQAHRREIEDAAQELEVKVEERTHALARKNAELQRTVDLLQRTREQLVLAEKLSALGQMAAGVAHEINNPAAVILGNLEVLAAELGEHARPVTREIEFITQQVERIRHIVTSLTQFARSSPSQGPVADIEINRVIDGLVPLIEPALKRKSVAFTRRLAATGTVAINVFDLEQVLINLVMNAVNAVTEGGAIEIATNDAEDGVVIGVRDNGAGIPPERLARIFDPFFSTDPHRGLGLGLSVSYGLVRRYGGHITVQSVVGYGSVFKVRLHRRPNIAAGPAAQSPSGRVTTADVSEEVHYG